ncbi:MAG: hypothetical protein ACYTFO_05225 [Planctomycetota bacterium]
MTLVELTIGMSVMSVIGLTIAGVSMALANACQTADDYYQSVQTGRVTTLRMGNLLRSARLVTDASDSALLVWHGDPNDNRDINISELTLISHDTTSQKLLLYRIEFPANWREYRRTLFDGLVPLGTARLNRWPYLWYHRLWGQTSILAENVTAFEVQVDASPPRTQRVSVQMTIQRDGRPYSTRNTTVLRDSWTDRLSQAGSSWTLEP